MSFAGPRRDAPERRRRARGPQPGRMQNDPLTLVAQHVAKDLHSLRTAISSELDEFPALRGLQGARRLGSRSPRTGAFLARSATGAPSSVRASTASDFREIRLREGERDCSAITE